MAPQLNLVIFCDDIRNEAGNKVSLVGVYGNQLFLEGEVKFPAVLPKLCAFLRWTGIKGGEKVRFSVEYEGKEIVKPPAPMGLEAPRFGPDYSQTSIHMIPFPLLGFGNYILKIFLDDKEAGTETLKIGPPHPK